MSISIGPDIVIGRRGISLSGGGAAAIPWWLSGDISAANAIAVYQPIGAASLAASYVNLANPGTYDATAPVAAPTFDAATGWTFNGSTQYLSTGVVGDGTWSALVRFTNATSGSKLIMGAQANSPAIRRTLQLGPWWDDVGGARSLWGAKLNVAFAFTGRAAGVSGLAGLSAYMDGNLAGTITDSGDATTNAIYIGAQNLAGSANAFWSGKIQAVAIYNTTLTADQVAAVSAAMAAL